MIVDERMATYLNSLGPDLTPQLAAVEEKAREEYVPIIRKETQNFLRWLLMVQKPQRILEVGTAVGFSAMLMAEYDPADCHITTIENYEKRIPIAKANFKAAGLEERITLLEGDAAQILPTLEGEFDFIFMDAAKGQYPAFWPQVKRLLAPGGMVVTDNVLQDGDIIESHYAVTRRNRTIYKRMREYLYTITHDPDLTTTILPVGDGIALTIKNQMNVENR